MVESQRSRRVVESKGILFPKRWYLIQGAGFEYAVQ